MYSWEFSELLPTIWWYIASGNISWTALFLRFLQRQSLKYSHCSKINKRKSYRISSVRGVLKFVFSKNKTKFSVETLAMWFHSLVHIYCKIPRLCRYAEIENNMRFLWYIRTFFLWFLGWSGDGVRSPQIIWNFCDERQHYLELLRCDQR